MSQGVQLAFPSAASPPMFISVGLGWSSSLRGAKRLGQLLVWVGTHTICIRCFALGLPVVAFSILAIPSPHPHPRLAWERARLPSSWTGRACGHFQQSLAALMQVVAGALAVAGFPLCPSSGQRFGLAAFAWHPSVLPPPLLH